MAAPRLLEDVRVVDLSQYIPGPFATRQLADLGADVIKIEPPGGDPMRQFMCADAGEDSSIYGHVNRGKRVCRLDLKSAKGRQILTRLLAGADILLESFRPGVLARLGFDRERLGRINPRLIHCALSGYGQNGPYALRAGHDINSFALSSQAFVSGTADRPVIGFPPIADHAAALQAAISMLAALHARPASGVFLDISITESILAWQYLPAPGGRSGRAESLLNGGAACYNIYRCADGAFVSLGAIENEFWENFCTALQQPGWIARQFEPMPQQSLIAEVAAVIGAAPRPHWQALFDDVDCCFEALLTPDETRQHPHLVARRAFVDSVPGFPGWIGRRPPAVVTAIEEIDADGRLEWKTSEA